MPECRRRTLLGRFGVSGDASCPAIRQVRNNPEFIAVWVGCRNANSAPMPRRAASDDYVCGSSSLVFAASAFH